ncbi:LuxR C-terminal-related transcriptional regulator [Spongiimicrobium salis]|uniref:LuxR C-terminal-related transcriptional regulator n=1 Tax=Spongiimicrobium salis TaxID=1667022 RepID=UPI00374CDE8D
MNDTNYFSHLYGIASHLNKEFSLHSTLRKSLEMTAEMLEVETAWFWLTEPDNKSVYLAASHNLPPALSNHPERLSGWCYCIKQYLSDDMDEAMNISEISCSRLKDISAGTKGLKFHAVIPIIVNGQKVGLMNLLSEETRQLDEKELTILNTVSELIGTAIQRTRLQHSHYSKNNHVTTPISGILERVFLPKIEALIACLDTENSSKKNLQEAMERATDLKKQLSLLHQETAEQKEAPRKENAFHYPELPLTKRELEVITLIKQGLTNDQIGKRLFITERTVKFHVSAILSKLNAENRTEAVDISLKRGFLGI